MIDLSVDTTDYLTQPTMKSAQSSPGSPARNKIQSIESSIRCFIYSLAGLVPLIGLPFSLAAIIQSRKVRKAVAGWNPADRYLSAASAIGPLGFLTTIGFLIVVCVILPAIWRDLGACRSAST